MKRFIRGQDRSQSTLFPESLEEYIADDNTVRVVDAYVDELDLRAMGFERAQPKATGRPSYHPSILLKLYIYGYLNRIQSSRRLEREAGRNIELMWLTGKLAPDFKTIADFRKDNGPAIQTACSQFIVLCRELGLLAATYVPKPYTSGSKAACRFGKYDFLYQPEDNSYQCPGGQTMTYRYMSVEHGRDALSDQTPQERQNRDEPLGSRL